MRCNIPPCNRMPIALVTSFASEGCKNQQLGATFFVIASLGVPGLTRWHATTCTGEV